MRLTAVEARKKICPLLRIGMMVAAPESRVTHTDCLCLADGCMMWGWACPDAVQQMGFCGLVAQTGYFKKHGK